MTHEKPKKEEGGPKPAHEALPSRIETVTLYGTAKIETKPGDTEQVVLSTEKLNGCTAVLLFRQYENGEREAQLSHFPPIFIDSQLKSMSTFERDSQRKEADTSAFFYVERGRADTLPQLEAFIRTTLGITKPPHIEAYDRGLSRENAGTLKVTVPPEGPVTIQMEKGTTSL